MNEKEKEMIIESVVVGPYATNCYVAACGRTGEAVIIDPGAEPDAIIDCVERMGVVPRAVLCTHGHPDHVGAVAAMTRKYRVPFRINSSERVMLQNAWRIAGSRGEDFSQRLVADGTLEDGELFEFGSAAMKVLHTPGHTPGGVCLLSDKNLFAGDTLFRGAIGRVDLPGGSQETLLRSIVEKLFTLDDKIAVHPGHGPATTIGRERKSNPFVGDDAISEEEW